MKTQIHLRGKIFSGAGEGAKFIQLPWVKKQVKEKLGFTPYPGTLNIKLSNNNIKPKLFANANPLEILPVNGFFGGKCLKAQLVNSLECAIVLPEVEGYPQDVIEIIAPVNLRKKLKVKDGDILEVKITL